ncbi:putative peroxisome biosynthesis protein (Peroxine-7) [Amylocarpus encephaloides]|uniref:Peroxin-7 n=1 Tax=Amylocarpus encephaloides TaxID=45428 RepID=A0A9P7YP46_9HELO|nr:putative peroxisome biosynthesis protein (Peroxine-7) [Amylocarpus encephaloides]
MEYRTTGFNGYAVQYSPFVNSSIAVGAAANFGLVGNGRLYFFDLTAQGIVAQKWYNTQDAIYDIAYSEQNANQLIAGCGDGTVKLFDTKVPDYPIMEWKEHNREVYAVAWNLVSKDTFVSSSWDGTIKLYSPERPQALLTLPTHSCTYSTHFSPHSPSIISSVTSDSHLRVFDLRTPASASNHLVHLIPIHGHAPQQGPSYNPLRPRHPPSEALTHDWNKYRDTTVATAGVDTIIRTFDIRHHKHGATAHLEGHKYAVRRIAWSPHAPDMLLSASYDMTCRVWSDRMATPNITPGSHAPSQGAELGRMDVHTEFVTGVDWCLFGGQGWCASTAWDERLLVWDARSVMNQR